MPEGDSPTALSLSSHLLVFEQGFDAFGDAFMDDGIEGAGDEFVVLSKFGDGRSRSNLHFVRNLIGANFHGRTEQSGKC